MFISLFIVIFNIIIIYLLIYYDILSSYHRLINLPRKLQEINTNNEINNQNTNKTIKNINKYKYDSIYPTYIPNYTIRKDSITNKPVEHGRIRLIGGLNNLLNISSIKYSYNEFKEILQCNQYESGLDGNRGSISFLKYVPPTKLTLEMMCTWAEDPLICSNWKDCSDLLIKYKYMNQYSKSLDNKLASPYHIKLIRIMNNKIYIDWPWGISRFTNTSISYNHIRLFNIIINKINNLPNSTFFFGDELPYLPNHFPFFGLSNSPSINNIDIPFPWPKSVESEILWYREAQWDNNNESYSQLIYNKHHSKDYNEWKNRNPKLGFYGSVNKLRHIFYDIARISPEYIDAKWTNGLSDFDPYNIYSYDSRYIHKYNENNDTYYYIKSNNNINYRFNELVNQTKFKLDKESIIYKNNFIRKFGYLESLLDQYYDNGYIDYLQLKYKYLIVLLGLHGEATADRLAELILHSGSVILLQASSFEYHFSIHYKPWIHYVPITNTAADIIEKLQWLRDHDHMAYKLAKNSKSFGDSYLRLEDYLCYTNELLHTIGSIESNSDVLESFQPIQIIHDRLY